jgi:hypothetical protein
MSIIAASDQYLFAQQVLQQTALEATGKVRLFVNNLPLSPGNVLGDFAEASFAGYSPVDLAGKLSLPKKLRTGVWGCAGSPIIFTPLASSHQVVYGAYVTIGSLLAFSWVFINPRPIIRLSNFSANFDFEDWDLGTAQN